MLKDENTCFQNAYLYQFGSPSFITVNKKNQMMMINRSIKIQKEDKKSGCSVCVSNFGQKEKSVDYLSTIIRTQTSVDVTISYNKYEMIVIPLLYMNVLRMRRV